MILPKKIKDIFNNEPVHQLATSSKNGVPNISKRERNIFWMTKLSSSLITI